MIYYHIKCVTKDTVHSEIYSAITLPLINHCRRESQMPVYATTVQFDSSVWFLCRQMSDNLSRVK